MPMKLDSLLEQWAFFHDSLFFLRNRFLRDSLSY